MPQLFKSGPYIIFFWANEGDPLEPVHVHIAQTVGPNATKVWLSAGGKCSLCNNNSRIPERVLRNLMRLIESQAGEITEKWLDFYGQISFYSGE